MTAPNETPLVERLRALADKNNAADIGDLWNALDEAADALTAQAQEIERLRTALRYQDDRDGRIGTHGPECYSYGPRHYECAVREIERLREELSKMRGAEPSDEEINAIIGKHFELPGNACRAHAVIAEVLRAQPAASAEPVAYAAFADNGNIRIWSREPLNVPGCVPLYTAPPAAKAEADDARDAARYRWLRDPCSGAERVIFYCRGDYGRGLMSSAMLDAAIDRAIEGAKP